MERAWKRMPRTATGKVRLAAVLFASISLGRYIVWHSGEVFGLLPFIGLTGVLMHALHTSLTGREQAAAREALLARTGGRLLNRTDVHEVRGIVRETAVALRAQPPGTGLLLLRRDGGAVVVEDVVGFPGTVRGALLPVPPTAVLDQPSGEIVRLPAGWTGTLDQLVAGRRHWRAIRLATADADRFLLLGGVCRIPDEMLDAFQTLETQRSMAEANCHSHAQLVYRAYHDPLTGLPNRSLFFQRMAAAVDDAKGNEDSIALLLVDLDNFKQVNDAYGHGTGDEALTEVARRLASAGGDRGVPGRFGGDEFALLLTGLDSPAEADRVAERLRARLLEPLELSQATVSMGVSIGLAGGAPALTAGGLMRCADIAMYSAKARGKNRVERFSSAHHGDIAHVRQLEEHLAHAVERGEIILHHQPQVELETGRCVGVEALARWQHPTLGLLPPTVFIPMAERTGQIVTLGYHVLRTACRQAAAWTTRLPAASELRIAVNVAARQLLDPRFADTVQEVLRDSGLPAHRLTLELTESELIDEEAARVQLQGVAQLGVKIAIDDFGTGYASLASLRSFPVHQLKIDRTFLSQGDEDSADKMFQLVISVGRILDLETVAEGVETGAQAAALRRAGVSIVQGYLFAPPLPERELTRWLANVTRAVSRNP
jgi:diguanylate cyclase (GGDEF)-like protein